MVLITVSTPQSCQNAPQIERALRDGMDLRGVFYWTLTDNWEWAQGWGEKFGLYRYDFVVHACRYTDLCLPGSQSLSPPTCSAPKIHFQMYQAMCMPLSDSTLITIYVFKGRRLSRTSPQQPLILIPPSFLACLFASSLLLK